MFYYTEEPANNVTVLLEQDSVRRGKQPPSLVWYSPLLSGSLFAQTPREEFQLLRSSFIYDGQKVGSGFLSEVLERWGLHVYADSHIHTLSGGFRKLLFVATQVEARQNGEHVVAINVQQQLDVQRVSLVEQTLIEKGVSSVLWVDDNPSLLLKKVSHHPRLMTLSEWFENVVQ